MNQWFFFVWWFLKKFVEKNLRKKFNVKILCFVKEKFLLVQNENVEYEKNK